MVILGRMALAIAPLFALWAVVTALVALRSNREDFASTSRRGLAAAAACAAVAAGALVVAVVRHDFTIRFAVDNTSWHLPARFLPAAMLGDAGGALLAWAAIAGAAGLIAVRSAGGVALAAWISAVIGASLAVALGAVALAADPFATVIGVVTDGAAIPPERQHAAAATHAVALLAASAAAVPAFALTVAALAARTLDDRWSAHVRIWNAITWCALIIALVAGARWVAAIPTRGAWLTHPAVLHWLLPGLIGAWLVHLDAGRRTAGRAWARVVLVTLMLATTTAAMVTLSGAFLGGIAPRTLPDAGAWFAVVPLGVCVLMALLSRARGDAAVTGAQVNVAAPAGPGPWLRRAGFILVAGAAAGSAFARSHDLALADAEAFRTTDPFGHAWEFTSQGVSTMQRENYATLAVSLLPRRNGQRGPMLTAEARSYVTDDPRRQAREVGTAGSVANMFLEVRLSIRDADVSPRAIRIEFVPLAPWLIPGAALIVVGTLASLAAPSAEPA